MSIEFYGCGRLQERVRYVQFSSERHGGALPAAPRQLVAARRKSIGERIRETRSEDQCHFSLVFAEFRRRIELIVGFIATDAKG